MKKLLNLSLLVASAMLAAAGAQQTAEAQLVPGTGRQVPGVGDDFEDEGWNYIFNGYKSSNEQDKRSRSPGGKSVNGRLYESGLRGHPDVIKRIETPEGGIEGSKGALMLRTLYSGVPGQFSHESMQDDLICVGRTVPVSYLPSFTVRVFLPPEKYWEPRNGAHFGFRAEIFGSRPEPTEGGLFRRPGTKIESEISWPGIFVSMTPRQGGDNHYYFVLRGHERGDFRGPDIKQLGWWTLGMSFTQDGRCHYYASPGVDDLTEEDRIASHYPYNYRIKEVKTMFFDMFNKDDGKSWSTPMVIDDPAMYIYDRQASRIPGGRLLPGPTNLQNRSY